MTNHLRPRDVADAKERLLEAQFRGLFEEARRRWTAGDDGKR